jgi:hypothetical protein
VVRAVADTRFRESRWRRAGATGKQLDELAAAHADMTPDEQAAEAARVDSVSDVDLAAELDAQDTGTGGKTIAQVLAEVEGDPELAAVALSHENAQPKPRPRLVTKLQEIITATAVSQDG